MKNQFVPFDIIQDLYAEQEQDRMFQDFVKFSVSLEGEKLALFDAVAEHFSTTRTRIISGILNESVTQLIFSIEEADRSKVLGIAHDKTMKFHEDLMAKNEGYNFAGTSQWAVWKNTLDNKSGDENADS